MNSDADREAQIRRDCASPDAAKMLRPSWRGECLFLLRILDAERKRRHELETRLALALQAQALPPRHITRTDVIVVALLAVGGALMVALTLWGAIIINIH